MRARIKVGDLNLRQWDYLATKVPVDGRDFLPGLPRVCAVFELAPEISELHIEMDVTELAGLLVVLEGIRNDPDPALVAEAALSETPGSGRDGDRHVSNTGAATATGPGSVANTGYMGR